MNHLNFFALGLKNYRTTFMGVGAILAALGDVITQLSTQEWDTGRLGGDAMGLFTGIGLIFARDSITSEHEHHEDREKIEEHAQEIQTNTAQIAQVAHVAEVAKAVAEQK
jgi:hypothetical protein